MKKKIDYYFIFGVICAVWFMLTSWFWVYYLNLIFSLPIGIIGYFLYAKGKKLNPEKENYKYILHILALGIVFSLFMLIEFTLR